MKIKKQKGITLVALVITIIILLLLAGIAIATLGGENGIFAKVKQAKKAQLEAEMKEQLTMALQELQIARQGNATLDDVTQDWANKAILKDYSPLLQEDASLNGKLIIMTKNKIKGKFLIDQNLNIEKIEYNTSSLEFEYTTVSRVDNKVKINIVVTDRINGIKQIDYPEGNPLKVVDGKKEQISIDYNVELEKEYKFVITTGDGNKTEKIIKIDDYFYNVTKDLGESATINNNATKAAYNKTYEATISAEGNYAITSLVVTMGEQTVTTTGGNEVDINTGKIKIEKVTGDINIKVTTKKLEIKYTAVAVHTSNSPSNTRSLNANSVEAETTLYINIIAKLGENSCIVVEKTNNKQTVPYAVTKNGKYTFIVSGTYNGKTISEEKEVIVNQYITVGLVQYDAGDWTKEEIEELKNKNLYMINKEKKVNDIFNLNDPNNGLNFTFGGFTYKGDTANSDEIDKGTIAINRNQSISCYISGNEYKPQYSGWQILESKVEDQKVYVNKIIHAGSPENFVYCQTQENNGSRAEYLLSNGKKETTWNTLKDGTTLINYRNWDMYKDKKLNEKNYIKDVHIMTYQETLDTTKSIVYTKSFYWLETHSNDVYSLMYHYGDSHAFGEGYITYSGGMHACIGIRPVVEMNDGVYIKSGSGTEEDPYILGKDE